MITPLLAPTIDDATRRQFLIGTAAAVLLAGRGEQSDEPAASPGGGFPVTIDHQFGSTTIPASPERIVVAGLVEQDPLLALGIVPVATTEWFGDHPGAIHPWAREALGDAPLPEVLSGTDGYQFERIAALGPDLILALMGGPTEQADYDTLSRIAPTLVQPAGLPNTFSMSWQDLQRTVGRAVGQPERAEQLVAATEARLAEVKAAHPEFTTSTAAYIDAFDGTVSAYTPADPSVFLTELGFKAPPELAEVTRAQGYAEINQERFDLLEADLLYVAALTEDDRDELLANPLYTRLDVHTEGRDVIVVDESDPELYGAVSSFIGVLSFPVIFDRMVPKLAAAADGDPATEVPA